MGLLLQLLLLLLTSLIRSELLSISDKTYPHIFVGDAPGLPVQTWHSRSVFLFHALCHS